MLPTCHGRGFIFLKIFSNTDKGLTRDNNEDSIRAMEDLSLGLLADGMGGHQAGEIASKMAVDLIGDFLSANIPPETEEELNEAMLSDLEENLKDLVSQAIHQANRAIFDKGRSSDIYERMGTTLVLLLVRENFALLAHVGDSRIYKVRNGFLNRETDDHSFVYEQLKEKLITEKEARDSIFKNMVTRALGVREDVEPDIKIMNVQVGDIFLLCSDGLTDLVTDEEIEDIILTNNIDLQAAAQKLVDTANHHGGIDNVSVVLGRVLHDVGKHSIQFRDTDRFSTIK